MLKLTYTETSFHLELLAQSLEEWVQGRVILSLRVGQRFLVEPTTASFLLPRELPELSFLQAAADLERNDAIAIGLCDASHVEVSLQGTWIAALEQSVEGVFVTALSDRTEFFLLTLWQQAQACTSCINSG